MDMYSVIINVSTLCFACGNARGSHGRYLFLETHTIGVGLPETCRSTPFLRSQPPPFSCQTPSYNKTTNQNISVRTRSTQAPLLLYKENSALLKTGSFLNPSIFFVQCEIYPSTDVEASEVGGVVPAARLIGAHLGRPVEEPRPQGAVDDGGAAGRGEPRGGSLSPSRVVELLPSRRRCRRRRRHPGEPGDDPEPAVAVEGRHTAREARAAAAADLVGVLRVHGPSPRLPCTAVGQACHTTRTYGACGRSNGRRCTLWISCGPIDAAPCVCEVVRRVGRWCSLSFFNFV